MVTFSNAVEIATTSANAASFELIGSSNDRMYLWEIVLTLESAPGAISTFGLCAPTARGGGPIYLTSQNEVAWSKADTDPSSVVAWGTAPTYPPGGKFFRTASLDNVVGESVVWQFPRGLVVPSTLSLVLWNITAVGNTSVSWVWDD